MTPRTAPLLAVIACLAFVGTAWASDAPVVSDAWAREFHSTLSSQTLIASKVAPYGESSLCYYGMGKGDRRAHS